MSATPRPQLGQVINNKYRLLRLVGEGGMGTVYEARHEMLGVSVALKFLHGELSRRPGLVQRFLQEARVSAQIQSPHVVRVMDVDQASTGLAFMVLEYIQGHTLQAHYEELYRAGERLQYDDALDFAMQMIEGVEAAHAAGVVHRDLKPDNVMITKTSKGATVLKILDFGIAKLKLSGELSRGLTRPGVVMGTPEYMAPEQAYSADSVDVRADIFSLGVILFEMLAGRRPVGGAEPQAIAASYLAGRIEKIEDLVPGIAPDLAAIVHRAMLPLAKDRFATVAELRAAMSPFAPAPRTTTPMTSRSQVSQVSFMSSQPPVVPAASAVPATDGGSEPRRVPKTLPPEDGPPEPGYPPVQRPGGTVMGASSGSGTVADFAGTASMDPYAVRPPPTAGDPMYGSAAPPIPARRRKSGSSAWIFIAGGLAVVGLAVGGVFLLQQQHHDDSSHEPPRQAGPPPPVTPQPQPQPQPPPQPQPQPPQPVTTTPPTPQPRPPNTKPTTPPTIPTIPPLVIPSAFPFPFPGQPPPQQPAPNNSGQPPPPQNTSQPPGPIIIPVPH